MEGVSPGPHLMKELPVSAINPRDRRDTYALASFRYPFAGFSQNIVLVCCFPVNLPSPAG